MSKDFDIEKLRGSENYHTWRFAIQNVLAYKGYSNCISDPVRETDNSKLVNCKAILSLSVDTHIYVHIQKFNTASDIWKALKNLYEDKGLTRKIGLLRSLISTRLEECDNMQQYVDNVVCYSNKLTGVGFSISDEWIAAILLAGLTHNFKPFIMGIEATNGDIKSDALIMKLLDSQSNENIRGEALIGKKKPRGDKTEKRKCFNCGKIGHMAKTCRKKKKRLISERQKPLLWHVLMEKVRRMVH